MKDWKPQDYVIVMFSAVISLMLIAVMYNSIVLGIVLSPSSSKNVSAIITSLIAIISMWIGNKIKK